MKKHWIHSEKNNHVRAVWCEVPHALRLLSRHLHFSLNGNGFCELNRSVPETKKGKDSSSLVWALLMRLHLIFEILTGQIAPVIIHLSFTLWNRSFAYWTGYFRFCFWTYLIFLSCRKHLYCYITDPKWTCCRRTLLSFWTFVFCFGGVLVWVWGFFCFRRLSSHTLVQHLTLTWHEPAESFWNVVVLL